MPLATTTPLNTSPAPEPTTRRDPRDGLWLWRLRTIVHSLYNAMFAVMAGLSIRYMDNWLQYPFTALIVLHVLNRILEAFAAPPRQQSATVPPAAEQPQGVLLTQEEGRRLEAFVSSMLSERKHSTLLQ